MVKVKKKKIAFVCLGLSFLFFFNPNIIMIDLLPDLFGYLLLIHAITVFADLNEMIAEARDRFRKLIFLDAGKLLALYWSFSSDGSYARSSSLLMWSFVFMILELLLVLPAYSKLFNGLIQLGNFHPNTAIHGGKRGSSYTDRIRRCTVFFVIAKNVLSFLPELLDLDRISEFESAFYVDLYRYVGLLRGLAFLVIFSVGLIWLIRIERYVIRLAKDKPFIESVEKAYEINIVPKVGLFVKRELKISFFMLFLAALCSVDLYLDQINFIPDLLTACLMIRFFVGAQRTVPLKKPVVWSLLGVYFGVTAAADWLDFWFRMQYSVAALKNEAMKVFRISAGLSIASLLLFVAVLILAFYTLVQIIRYHTGHPIGVSDSEKEREFSNGYQAELRDKMIPLLPCTVFFVVAQLLVILRPAMEVFFRFELWFLDPIGIVLSVILAILVFFIKEAIYHGIEAKYMLE